MELMGIIKAKQFRFLMLSQAEHLPNQKKL